MPITLPRMPRFTISEQLAVMNDFGEIILRRGGFWPPPRTMSSDQVDECLQTYLDLLADNGEDDPAMGLGTAQVQLSMRISVRWVQQGLPLIEIGHQLAAAMCCSRPDPGSLELLEPPWLSFVILVPPGLIHFARPDGGNDEATLLRAYYGISMVQGEPRFAWNYDLQGTVGSLWQSGLTAADLASERTTTELWTNKSEIDWEAEDIDLRAMTLARALLRGVLALCNDPEKKRSYHRAPGTSTKAKKAQVQKYGRPIAFDRYVVTEPVKIDLRDVVQRYLGGERASPTVRHLVRGHYKSQPYGPGRSERRSIFVQPYWRGDDALPTAIKRYQVSDDGGAEQGGDGQEEGLLGRDVGGRRLLACLGLLAHRLTARLASQGPDVGHVLTVPAGDGAALLARLRRLFRREDVGLAHLVSRAATTLRDRGARGRVERSKALTRGRGGRVRGSGRGLRHEDRHLVRYDLGPQAL